MSKMLMVELKWKKKIYAMWKRGLHTWEEYRSTVRECRDATRKAKTLLELNLVREIKNKNQGFFKSVNSKWKTRENVNLLLNKSGALQLEG